MADSIQLYNGYNDINVNTLDILREPNQQLANAIATGPQDEFFSKLEECNRVLTGFRNEFPGISVTPSWNWRPGTLNIIKEYVAKNLMINKKSSGLGKYVSRTAENARYRLSWMATKLEQCEEIKRMLKREGYLHDVNIEEYIEKLVVFCNSVEESIEKATEATDGKVIFTPYIHILQNDERQATFYIDCYVNPGEMNVCQDSELIQKVPITGVKIMFSCHLRNMMKYLDKPNAMNMKVQYKGLNDSPIFTYNSYRTRQITYHPYIAQPTGGESVNVHWSTVCFSNFTDNIRKAFHDLNFVVLSMELLEWAGYYNTSHANPYNNLSFMHIGMPSNFSRAYQAVVNRDTSSCGDRVRLSMQTEGARDFSKQNCRDRVNIVEHCQAGIDCIWRDDCHLFKNYSTSLKRIADEENVFKYESILGAMIEHYNESIVISILYEDIGCFLDNSLPETHEASDLVLYDYEDALNYIVMYTKDINFFECLLKEMFYWGKDKEEKAIPVDEDITGEDDNIKRAMLQWATGRGM